MQDKNLKDNNINLINNFLRQIHYYSNSFNFFNSDTAQSVNDAMTKISTIFQDYTKITQENNDPVIYHNEIVEDSVPLLINGNMQKVMINNDDIKKSISNYQNPDQLFLGSEVKYQYAKNVASSIINHQFFPIVNLSKNKLKIAVYQLKGVTIRNQTPSTAISQGGHFYSIVNINNQWKLANTLPYCIQSGSSLSALYPSSSNNIIPAINLACYEKCNQEIEINL